MYNEIENTSTIVGIEYATHKTTNKEGASESRISNLRRAWRR